MKLLTAGWWEGSEEGSYRSLRSLQDDRRRWSRMTKEDGHSGAERSGAVESEGGDPIGRWRSLQDDRVVWRDPIGR